MLGRFDIACKAKRCRSQEAAIGLMEGQDVRKVNDPLCALVFDEIVMCIASLCGYWSSMMLWREVEGR